MLRLYPNFTPDVFKRLWQKKGESQKEGKRRIKIMTEAARDWKLLKTKDELNDITTESSVSHDTTSNNLSEESASLPLHLNNNNTRNSVKRQNLTQRHSRRQTLQSPNNSPKQ